MKGLGEYIEETYTALRVVTGLLFAFHGVQKVFGVFIEMQPPLFSQLWIGGVIELVGGLAVLLGFQTRLAAFICCGEMAVAYF